MSLVGYHQIPYYSDIGGPVTEFLQLKTHTKSITYVEGGLSISFPHKLAVMKHVYTSIIPLIYSDMRSYKIVVKNLTTTGCTLYVVVRTNTTIREALTGEVKINFILKGI